ncbi:MAG TPA: hypothetical protein VFU05_02420 [Cyclobacteriaceae bacterium]|nr:hypothetical protein [Cyclobacteriaceae bacterium]
MEQPLFYTGQRVVCIDGGEPIGTCGTRNQIIEGKSYYITDPCRKETNKAVYVSLSGFNPNFAWRQDCFVPYDEDQKLENEIFESLKGKILTQ